VPVAGPKGNSESAVNLVYYLNTVLENIYLTLGPDIFHKWSDTFQHLIQAAVLEYSEQILKDVDNASQFKLSEGESFPLSPVKPKSGGLFGKKAVFEEFSECMSRSGLNQTFWKEYSL